ncbi:PIG-L family deacetylase [Brevibacillus ruminantium]|uniref:PIG-L family deacetylase n=1 Tax=Brevibacillus ruminantium TaxID=2950604 RepID=A0ABY4WJ33_9BACL|nr:PIG-L deacetylase family protein [Brevibacillus ruminantium]USG67140.1 PIG-L family deacetylase [Brevibacillus ruminantium]
MNPKRVLILAPHTDDAELGCGGFIARLVEQSAEVFVATFSTAEESVPKLAPPDTMEQEFYEAMSILGVPRDRLFVFRYPVRWFSSLRQEILEEIVALRCRIYPDIVLLPSSQDMHQDHQVIHLEGLRAFKETTVLGYELPWNQISFPAQGFIPLEQRFVRRKWEALQAYQSQIEMQRPYFTQAFIEGLAKMRGTQIKRDWAEAYEVLRMVL